MTASRPTIRDFWLPPICSEEVLIFKESIWSLTTVKLWVKIDFPQDRDTYLHRVGRAGRFGTKGLAINFVKPDEDVNESENKGEEKSDKQVLLEVQEGFKIKIAELPNELDTSLYMWKEEFDHLKCLNLNTCFLNKIK